MKNKKLFWALIFAALVLICLICVLAFLMYSGRQKEEKYYVQMRTAEQYLTAGDYEKMIEAYQDAINLNPENPEAYLELAQFFMDQEQYVEAYEYANRGFSATRDRRLENLLSEINEKRYTRGSENSIAENADLEEEEEKRDSPDLMLRGSIIDLIGDLCYWEYENTYGAEPASLVSDHEGYRIRFPGLGAYAYFKNTPEYPALIDSRTRIPQSQARPYKVELSSPGSLFIGFEDYISYEKLCTLFNTKTEPEYRQDLSCYVLSFDYKDCSLVIETDEEGNLCQPDARIYIAPKDLFKDEWAEPEEESEEETEENTFTLGGNTYTYDVQSIHIYGEIIEDLSPLENCKQLEELMLINCSLGSLEPLAGCSSLQSIVLNESTGFSDLSPLNSLSSLRIIYFHDCVQIDDISCLNSLTLDLLHVCGSSVTMEQVSEYMSSHPTCEVWFDFVPVRRRE